MYHGHHIIVLAPCYNEEAKIGQVVKRVHAVGFVDEMVVVDDGSTDNSALLRLGVRR